MKRKPTHVSFDDITRPMTEEEFAKIELAIRSMRLAKDSGDTVPDNDEFVITDFKNKIGGLMFMQTMVTETYKTCYVEADFKREGTNFPRILARFDVPMDETVEIFRSVCCSETNPDFSEWPDETEGWEEAARKRKAEKEKKDK